MNTRPLEVLDVEPQYHDRRDGVQAAYVASGTRAVERHPEHSAAWLRRGVDGHRLVERWQGGRRTDGRNSGPRDVEVDRVARAEGPWVLVHDVHVAEVVPGVDRRDRLPKRDGAVIGRGVVGGCVHGDGRRVDR